MGLTTCKIPSLLCSKSIANVLQFCEVGFSLQHVKDKVFTKKSSDSFSIQ